MGYQGGKLGDLFSTAPARDAAREMAENLTDFAYGAARANTPVKTGRTRDAWKREGVVRRRLEGAPAYEGEVRNPHYIAHFLEHGTKHHHVKPDDAKAVSTPDGPRADAEVSGIKPHKMMVRAAAATEAAAPALTAAPAEKWKQETEALAKRHRGIS